MPPHAGEQSRRGARQPGSERAGERTEAADAFARLEARLEHASQAAERLISEAAAEATAAAARLGGRGKPPPQGWQASGQSEPQQSGGELEALMQFVESSRELVPADLRRRLGEAIKEMLLALRALIDWYLERVDRRRGDRGEVEDIPVL